MARLVNASALSLGVLAVKNAIVQSPMRVGFEKYIIVSCAAAPGARIVTRRVVRPRLNQHRYALQVFGVVAARWVGCQRCG